MYSEHGRWRAHCPECGLHWTGMGTREEAEEAASAHYCPYEVRAFRPGRMGLYIAASLSIAVGLSYLVMGVWLHA